VRGPQHAKGDRDTDPNDALGTQELFQPTRPYGAAPVDTSSAVGRAFYGMLAVFAAFETDVRRERQLEGIAMAKRQDVYKGGKPRLDWHRVQELSSLV
jgi:DNA invertase Pin-like site-specific DNA recombinase